MQVRVEDESDSVILMAIGRGGESLFGIQCDRLVKQYQNSNSNDIPGELKRVLNQTKTFEVGYGNRSDFLIMNVYHEPEEASAESSQVSSTEKNPPKRSIDSSNQTSQQSVKDTKRLDNW